MKLFNMHKMAGRTALFGGMVLLATILAPSAAADDGGDETPPICEIFLPVTSMVFACVSKLTTDAEDTCTEVATAVGLSGCPVN